MKKIRRSQNGFTAVELLITLFVAAAFLLSGFQLYTFILRSGGESRQMALANNIAYMNLRQLSNEAATCPNPSSGTPVTTDITDAPTLTNPTITKTVSAPYGCPWDDVVKKVEITVNYGPANNRQGVHHALYVKI